MDGSRARSYTIAMSEAMRREDTRREIEALRREMDHQKRELEQQLRHQQWSYDMKLSDLSRQMKMERDRQRAAELDRKYHTRMWLYVVFIGLVGAWTVAAQLIF